MVHESLELGCLSGKSWKEWYEILREVNPKVLCIEALRCPHNSTIENLGKGPLCMAQKHSSWLSFEDVIGSDDYVPSPLHEHRFTVITATVETFGPRDQRCWFISGCIREMIQCECHGLSRTLHIRDMNSVPYDDMMVVYNAVVGTALSCGDKSTEISTNVGEYSVLSGRPLSREENTIVDQVEKSRRKS